MASRAAYRVRQFCSSLRARVSADDLRQADAYLPPEARTLFRQMPAADQRHSLAVMRALERAGHGHPALLTAALLHDVGKSAARLTPVHRAIIVLLGRFWPGALDWLAREPATGDSFSTGSGPGKINWRQPFIVHRRHPQLGAHWAEQAGCSATSVALIRRHQEALTTGPRDEIERWLIQLQRADKNE
jgi:hypothetical protein